jgi:Skp family chaperone for outer membrane proteins
MGTWHACCKRSVVVQLAHHLTRLIAIAVFSGSIAWGAATPSSDSPAKAPVDLQKLVEQSNQQRDRMIAEHDALARQLKDATEEKRREVYEKMNEQKKAFEAAQSALHKRIRDEQRAQRALQRSR